MSQNPMNLKHRKITASDIPHIIQMMKEFYAIDNYQFDLKLNEVNLLVMVKDETIGTVRIIELDGEVIGYFALTFGFSFEYGGRTGLLDEFYIREDYRGKGIGRATMDFIEKISHEYGINTLHMEVEVKNKNALKLYNSYGYSSNNRKLKTKKITNN
jgi:GNAT superfamily N-acetyltransferase